MNVVNGTDLIHDIRVAIDENRDTNAESLINDIDTLSLDEIIKSKIEDAAISVILAAPFDKLGDLSEAMTTEDLSISDSERHKAIMSLPNDFARLVRFKMSSWPIALFQALPPLPPQYDKANSKFNIYGTCERPVLFIVPKEDGLKLEIFCAASDSDTIEECSYIKKPSIQGNDAWTIKLGERLYRPTVYYAAYLTALAIKDADAATALQGIAKELLDS